MNNWWVVLKHLPPKAPLTADLLIACVMRIPEYNAAFRTRAVTVTSALAEFAGIEIDLSPCKVKTRKHSVQIKEIPTEQDIEDIFQYLWQRNKAYARQFALLACFGLRPHEVFLCSVTEPTKCRVLEGKTGPRMVRAIPAERAIEWWDMGVFSTSERTIPEKEFAKNKSQISYRRLGLAISRWFAYHNIKFTTYSLRHAYAIRGSVHYGFAVAIMARWMGHSPTVHLNEYNYWINQASEEIAYSQKFDGYDADL